MRTPSRIPFRWYRHDNKRIGFGRDMAFRSSDVLVILLRKLPDRWKRDLRSCAAIRILVRLFRNLVRTLLHTMPPRIKKCDVLWTTYDRVICDMVQSFCQIWQQMNISFLKYSTDSEVGPLTSHQYVLVYIFPLHVLYQPRYIDESLNLRYIHIALHGFNWTSRVYKSSLPITLAEVAQTSVHFWIWVHGVRIYTPTKFRNKRTRTRIAEQLRRSRFAPLRQFPEQDGEAIRTSKCHISPNSPPLLTISIPFERYCLGLSPQVAMRKNEAYLKFELTKYINLPPGLQFMALQFSISPNDIPNLGYCFQTHFK